MYVSWMVYQLILRSKIILKDGNFVPQQKDLFCLCEKGWFAFLSHAGHT